MKMFRMRSGRSIPLSAREVAVRSEVILEYDYVWCFVAFPMDAISSIRYIDGS